MNKEIIENMEDEENNNEVIESLDEIIYSNSTSIISSYFDFQIMFAQKTIDSRTGSEYTKEVAKIAMSPQQAEYLLHILQEHVHVYNESCSTESDEQIEDNDMECEDIAIDKDISKK